MIIKLLPLLLITGCNLYPIPKSPNKECTVGEITEIGMCNGGYCRITVNPEDPDSKYSVVYDIWYLPSVGMRVSVCQ